MEVDTLRWCFAGIIGVLQKAMQMGADPRAYAAVDLLLELLRHCGRSHLVDDCSQLLASLDGPKRLAAIGRAALEQGPLLASAQMPKAPITKVCRSDSASQVRL